MFFCKGCRNGKGRCNGRSKQGKDALSVCAQGLCKDAKPTKHTQTLTLRKARGIVWMQNQQSVHMARMWCEARDSAGLEGLVQAKDGGVAIPPVVARIFLGDSTSPLTREARVLVQSKG